ncbi:MAG: aspartate carbamoyltransferase catalytic subunit [Eubacteriales bacterium]
MKLSSKDLLGLKDLSKEEIVLILDTATTMKGLLKGNAKKMPHLQGKSIITLFYENSTRTKTSFELAGKFLGASMSSISASASSVQKGENLIDTGKTLDAMATDIIIMRHPMSGSAALLSQYVSAGIVNAGDGMNEHPTQALLDMYTMREKYGNLEGLNVSIFGDVLHSRVARSNLWGLSKLGANVTFCAPYTFLPKDIDKTKAKITSDKFAAAKGADVLMGLRIQKERQSGGLFPSASEYNAKFGIDTEVLKLAKKDAIVMHPGPVNRGIEITSEVADSSQSVINEQVTNGLAVRMALLYLLTRRNINENID